MLHLLTAAFGTKRKSADVGLMSEKRTAADVSLSPKVLKSLLAEFCIASRVLDGAMAEPILNCPRVVPFICQRIAAGMAQHVRVGLQFEAEAPTGGTLDHSGEARGREWRAAR